MPLEAAGGFSLGIWGRFAFRIQVGGVEGSGVGFRVSCLRWVSGFRKLMVTLTGLM